MDTDLTDWLIAELDVRGWSQRELARRSGISQGTVSQVLSLQQRPTWNFCAAIAGPLKVPVDEVFVLAGLKRRPAGPVQEEQEAVGILRALTDRARETVMAMLRGLAADEGVEVVPAAVNEGRLMYGLELEEDAFVPELLEAFQDVPVEWREEAVRQVEWVQRMSSLPPTRIIGDDAEDVNGEERQGSAAGAGV